MKTLLFVCTGNTCRSPMAAYLYKEYLTSIGMREITVESRGLAADGAPMAQNAAIVLAEMGIPALQHCSRPLTAEEALAADLICVMSEGHRQALLAAGVADEKVYCMQIPDPFGGDLAAYRACRDAIFVRLGDVSLRLSGYYIDRFREQDAPAAAALERQCFAEPWTKQGILDSYNNGALFFVARTAQGTAGYAGVQLTAGTGYVTNIAVNAAFRGRGLGRALTARLCYACAAQQAESITLEVRPSNAAAVALYRGLGFAEAGRRRDFYRNPREDALLMTKMLREGGSC